MKYNWNIYRQHAAGCKYAYMDGVLIDFFYLIFIALEYINRYSTKRLCYQFCQILNAMFLLLISN